MARRTTQPPPPLHSKAFTVPEIDAGIRKLRRRIEDVKGLEALHASYDDPRVDVVESDIKATIRDVFGPSSPEFAEHQYHRLWKGGIMIGEDWEAPAKFKAGMLQSIAILDGLIARLEEKRADLSESVAFPLPSSESAETRRRVFVVHGHDAAAKLSGEGFIRQLRLEPTVLSDRPNEGRTIIEKFEHHSDVAYAVVLLTPDDLGAAKADSENRQPRARQNVVLELGYFIGRLGRSKVCALYRGSVELPSDLHGVLYVPMDDGDGWKLRLAKEIKAAGLDVDMNLALG